jgi:putative toxin-antitoxin system antitoxin component (TIGR02293 family)
MAYLRSSASGSPVATSKRGASTVVKPPAKSIPAAKVKTPRVRAAKAAAASAGKSNATERPATKGAVLAVAKRKPEVVALARDKAPALSYITVYRASPLERIDMIRRGILASEAKRIFAELPIGQGAGFKALNLSTATVNKKAKHGDTLSPEESERIVGFAKLVGQLEAMIQDSGNPMNFDARAWMARWLTEPLPAFGGARPADLVDTMEGQGLVSAALAKVQSGAYA